MTPFAFARFRRMAAFAAVTATTAALLGGCVSPRDALGTNSSPCYKAIPVASEAVRDSGTLAGIRLVPRAEIDRHKRLGAMVNDRFGSDVKSLCVASFHGTYRLDQVERPLGSAPAGGTGKVAVVIVTYPDNKLIGTLVLTREPLPLRHEVIGVRPSAAGAPLPPT